MKTYLNRVIFQILCLLLLLSCSQPGSVRQVFDMNTGWAFYRGDVQEGEKVGLNDSNWMPVAIPHIMQLEKKHCGGNSIYDGVGWYRRYFTLSDAFKDKRIVISFEGVMTNCDVFVNGQKVTEHHGGYTGFVADISKLVQWGKNNVLAVRVSAEYDALTPPGKPQDKMDFYYYSGIYRDVRMVVTDKIFVTDALEEDIVAGGGQFVTFPKVLKEQAITQVKTHVRNSSDNSLSLLMLTQMKDSHGRVVARDEALFELTNSADSTIIQNLQVQNPHLWHPYHPYLYTLETKILSGKKVIDEVSQQIGIRTIKYTADKGFFINGEHLYLRGANRHQAYPNVGDAASNSMQERDVIDIKRGGYNAVRAAHYPQDPAFLDACDKYGLLVVECIPGWQYFNPDSIFMNRLFEVGKDMIRRDRNHPSIILWETALNESRYPVSLAKDIFNLTHNEYPGDQFYTSGDYFGHAEMEPYYDVFYKQVSKFPKDGDVMSNYPEDLVSIKPLFTREWGDGVGEKPRVSLMEDEEEQMRQCRSRMKQLNGQGYFDWCMLDANPHMGGHFLWSYNDYARGNQDQTMYSGVVDINRYPKFSYYMLQSMRDVSISQAGLYEGPMVYIASYNDGGEFVSSSHEIMVFSNAEEVKLYRNDHLVGRQTRLERAKLYPAVVNKGGSPLFVFDAGGYEAGTLKAEALVDGKVVATHSVQTPEAAHHLEVEVKLDDIHPVADGSDMIPVYVKVCDVNGTLVHDASHRITFQVEGEGKLIGDTISRIGINPQNVEGGVGFAFIRTTKRAGKIKVTAMADGIESGSAEIISKTYEKAILPDGEHAKFNGQEEDHVVQKTSSWQKNILKRPKVTGMKVYVSGSQTGYPSDNILDEDDHTWWIASSDQLPQVVTLELEKPTNVLASRILFQKDSSSYQHKVEYSADGKKWISLYETECTGWEFQPRPINQQIQYFRVTFTGVSEGRAGLGGITLYRSWR